MAIASTVFPHVSLAAAPSSDGDRPNVLWITTEDLSPVLGCCGDEYAVTPNLDRFAQQGVRYTHAFAMASVCTPARSCLITGVYSSSLGTQHLRGEQPLASSVHCYPEFLRQAGYYCTNNVKEDYNFTTPKAAWDESSNKAHWRNRRPGQPFFAIFNLMTTHQSRIRFSESDFAELTSRIEPGQRHDPALAPLPPYYPDTPVVRRDVARLYDLVTAMDLQVQDLLDQLQEDGLADDTIVFFYSDHGTGMPRHKRWLYDSGTRVPLIIRFPKKYQHLAPGGP
ncbi:MAG: sulfatase, partial [Planctomycetes bacterium]|nr:sulfatase [Planctomycetota bacterium]